MSGDTVLVTGAGYVGSRACKAHARAGYTPVTYDNIASGNRWAVRWGLLEFGDILDAGRVVPDVRIPSHCHYALRCFRLGWRIDGHSITVLSRPKWLEPVVSRLLS